MIKLKQILNNISSDNSQKYTVMSEKLIESLDELHKSLDYKNSSIKDSILMENFTMLGEWVSLNKDDLYEYKKTGNSWYSFVDINNIKHEIRILLNTTNEKYEVKIWFLDKNNKPNYSPPNVYNNLKYDTKIFNTHIYILLNELIPYSFKELSNETLFLPATDKFRYSLYKITLNNHLDKTKYKLNDLCDNIISISGILPR